MRGATLLAGGLLALSLLTGCTAEKGHEEVEVTGEATIDGLPIPQGTIMFVAADGATPTGGGTITDGRYVAKVPPGKKKVLIVGNTLVGQEPEYPGDPNSPMRDKFQMITPPAYNAEHLTPLTAEINAPQQGLDFALKKDVEGT